MNTANIVLMWILGVDFSALFSILIAALVASLVYEIRH